MCFGTSGLYFHKKESEITGSIEISRYPPVANECARHLEAVRERPGMVMYLPLLNDARVRNLEVATSMADHPWSTFGMSQERTSAWELGPILPHVRDASSQTSSEYTSCGLNECCFDHRLHVRHEPHSADVPNNDHRIGWMEMADYRRENCFGSKGVGPILRGASLHLSIATPEHRPRHELVGTNTPTTKGITRE